MKPFQTGKLHENAEYTASCKSLDFSVWNANLVKQRVEKKLLQCLHRLNDVTTVDEVRKIIWDLKYEQTVDEWLQMEPPQIDIVSNKDAEDPGFYTPI